MYVSVRCREMSVVAYLLPTAGGISRGCSQPGHSVLFSHAGLAIVPQTDAAAAEALKWAVMSTFCAQPTLIVLLLQSKPSKGYTRYLAHPRVHRVCTIPRRHQGHAVPHTSRLHADGTTVQELARCDADLLLVANAEGAAEYWKLQHAGLLAHGLQQAWGVPADTDVPGWLGALQQRQRDDVTAGTAVDCCPAQPTRFVRAPCLPAVVVHPCPVAPLPDLPATLTGTRQLRFPAGERVFTDGSKAC